jgi:hypothetical protein
MGDAYQWRTQMYLAWMPIVDEKSRVVYEPTEGWNFNRVENYSPHAGITAGSTR